MATQSGTNFHPRMIIRSFLSDQSRDSKRSSCSARSRSFGFTSHLPDQISQHSGVVSQPDVAQTQSLTYCQNLQLCHIYSNSSTQQNASNTPSVRYPFLTRTNDKPRSVQTRYQTTLGTPTSHPHYVYEGMAGPDGIKSEERRERKGRSTCIPQAHHRGGPHISFFSFLFSNRTPSLPDRTTGP